jgi:hypothetical protein
MRRFAAHLLKLPAPFSDHHKRMSTLSHSPTLRAARWVGTLLLASVCLGAGLGTLAAGDANAALLTIGSPLAVPATLNTAENLSYRGIDTAVPPTPEFPTGVVHTDHYGADAALWNATGARGEVGVPASGQALKVALEGCAQPALSGPPPLTQIHFQDLSPLPEGGSRVNLSSQGFNIPVCGRGGASGSTVSTYEPINLCVSRGDFVALNEEGGFVPGVYLAGVPYRVLGVVRGSTVDSFIKGNGTGNGAVLSRLDSAAMDGFAASSNEELMMQVTLGTGPDARYVCPGGGKDAPPVLPPITIRPQTDGINHERVVAVAIYCRLIPECRGTATLTLQGRHVPVGRAGFHLRGNTTSHLPIRVTPQVMTLIRVHHGVSTVLTAVVAGKTTSQRISVKIL